MRTSGAPLFLLALFLLHTVQGQATSITDDEEVNSVIDNKHVPNRTTDQCQPFDRSGTAVDGSFGTDEVNCVYGSITCIYVLPDGPLGGSLLLGSTKCPPSLVQHTPSSTSTNPSGTASTADAVVFASTSENVLPKYTRVRTQIPSAIGSVTSPPPVDVAPTKKGIPAAVVAGIVVAASLLGVVLALLIRRDCLHRRATERRATQIRRQTDTVLPFTHPSAQYFSLTDAPDLETQLQDSREQVDMLANRINEFEVSPDFGWGVHGEGEPPPEYV
ncbi:hypothetical protein B0H19DRAFT_1258575 [Mycena capillaripes]|nr:hypothetical protein B0H19DRAFT_1258575 [Mycena capillaripes]